VASWCVLLTHLPEDVRFGGVEVLSEAEVEDSLERPVAGDLKRKLIRGGIAVGVLVVVAVALIALLPGLSGVKSAIEGASPGWVAAAVGLQFVGLAGSVVFVQLVFADVAHPLTWRMGGAQQSANALLPTAGSTAVGYWTLTSIGWGTRRFAERTAVMIIAPAAPNIILIVIVGLGMGIGLFPGPDNPWLTFLPAVIAALVIVIVIAAARWGHRLAARTKRNWLREGLNVVATGVTGTVEVLRAHSWRVLGTWVDLLFAIAALWACLRAVDEHLPFAVVAMGYLIGQLAQVIPVPGGIGTVDAGVTGALILYGGGASISAGGEIIDHAIALLVPLIAGGIAAALLPGEIKRQQAQYRALTIPPATST
jgi:uncharacterized membrane protein YbhN (UPF0104 family)